MGRSTRNVFNSKGSLLHLFMGLPTQALFIQTGAPCSSSQRPVLPGVVGWTEEGCCHFLGGRDTLSPASPSC